MATKRVANKGKSTQEETSEPKNIGPGEIADLIKAQIDPLKKELGDYKAKIIEVLGVFVALFTFISIDFQIFKENTSVLSAVGISLVTLGSLSFFILLLFVGLNHQNDTQNKNRNYFLFLFVISIVFISGGIFCIWKDGNDNIVTKSDLETYISNEQVKSMIDNAVSDEEFSQFKKCLRDGQWNKCLQGNN